MVAFIVLHNELWTALVSTSSLWSFSEQFLPPPTPPAHLPPPVGPPTPLLRWAKIGEHHKNDLKWPKIKQETNSNLYYITINRLLSPVLLNKVGLTRAKAGYTK